MRITSYKELLALAFCLLGIFLLAWSLSGFAQRYGVAPRFSQGPANAISGKSGGDAVTYSIKEIVDAHLFGKAEQKQQVVDQAPKTQLKLNLLGVLATDNSDYARALIQVQSKKMQAILTPILTIQ